MAKTKKQLEQLDETGNRNSGERRENKTTAEAKAAAPAVQQRKVKRRRQIDPTTCEREYSELEIEFMQAMDEYKRTSGRMFPTCSEILEVLTKLGYGKINERQAIYDPEAETEFASEEELDSIEDQLV